MTTQTSPSPAPLVLPGRKLQVENSISGKLVRRWNFSLRYLRARTHLPAIHRFQPILERFFDHEWLAGAKVKLRFFPGNEERVFKIRWPDGKYLLRLRWLPWREEECAINWSSPIVVMILKNGKDGGKPVTVRYMSFFLRHDIIHITQLQGVPLIEMPKGLRNWPERFVNATMEFARQENFRGVWIARAESLYCYHHPYIRWFMPPEVRDRDFKRIRANIELHHNQTAIDLGFQADDDWFKWQNPAAH